MDNEGSTGRMIVRISGLDSNNNPTMWINILNTSAWTGWKKVGEINMVADFDNYATDSTNGGGSFTAKEAGFIVGHAYAQANVTTNNSVTVNGVSVCEQKSVTGSYSTGYVDAYIPYKTGDSIVVTGTSFKCYKAVPME